MSLAADLMAESAATRVQALAALADAEGSPTPEERAALLACVVDERSLVQRRAAECCASLARRGVEVEPMLRAGLGDTSWRARWGAAYALAAIDALPFEALDTLLETLGLDNGDLRWAALDLVRRAVARYGRPVIDRLIEAAEHGSAAQRKMALYGLRDLEVREPACVAAAERALAPEADIELRLAGLAALVRLAIDRAAAARCVTRLLDDSDERMRRVAAATVGALGDRSPEVLAALARACAGSDPSMRRAAERSLRLLDEG